MSEFHGQPDSITPATYEAELVAAPTAWRSIPGAVRFAVWLWALSTLVGAVVGVVLAAGLVLGWAWS